MGKTGLDTNMVFVEVQFKGRPLQRIGPMSEVFAEAGLRTARKTPGYESSRIVKADVPKDGKPHD